MTANLIGYGLWLDFRVLIFTLRRSFDTVLAVLWISRGDSRILYTETIEYITFRMKHSTYAVHGYLIPYEEVGFPVVGHAIHCISWADRSLAWSGLFLYE
jgi:hypothetical protein